MDGIIFLALFLFAILIGYYLALYQFYSVEKRKTDLEMQELRSLINSATQSE